MNRLSILFAVIVAASFALSSAPAGDSTPSAATGLGVKRYAPDAITRRVNDPGMVVDQEANAFISAFRQKQGDFGPKDPEILFATVPDPIETHLAAAFDHNVAALQDGAEDSGYLFDSALIPWEDATTYETLADDLVSAHIRAVGHDYPGVLLFRRNPVAKSASFNADLVVFLFAEKPTAGIAIKQVENAVALLRQLRIPVGPEIRFLGPTFSGSLESIKPVLGLIVKASVISGRSAARALVRSGAVTSRDAAKTLLSDLGEVQPKLQVDLGSAEHQHADWMNLALKRLSEMGISSSRVAVLAEDESVFGNENFGSDSQSVWKIPFPRDISEVRASYEKQEVLDKDTPSTGWKRYLHLNGEDGRAGDTIPSFGGEETVAAKESMLFGITGFLRSHHIGAVIIVATNETDRYFLTRFLHLNNPGIRVVILGATRLFMRGSTAQFRGDMIVSDFPMLARLYDWTTETTAGYSRPLWPARIFPDDYSQGTYIAALDLLSEQTLCGNLSGNGLPPEYSGPPWGCGWHSAALRAAPPVYLSALGGDSAWPLWEEAGDGRNSPESHCRNSDGAGSQCEQTNSSSVGAEVRSPRLTTRQMTTSTSQPKSRLAMPFRFGQHFFSTPRGQPETEVGKERLLATGHIWKTSFWVLWGLAGIYVLAIFYANPVVRRKFAYLRPTENGRYWWFAVAIPSLSAGLGFLVLAWAHRFPTAALQDWKAAWPGALASSVLVSALMAIVSVARAKQSRFATAPKSLAVAFAPAVVMLATAIRCSIWHGKHPFSTGEILNIYREMYLESGLSLVPSALLLLLALAVWSYFAAVGTSLLWQSWILPNIDGKGRISFERGQQILDAAKPFPTGKVATWYWLSVSVSSGVLFVICQYWPSFADVTSLEDKRWTLSLLWFGYLISVLMVSDLVQFAWLWTELRDLLQALDREPLARSFLPLRAFSWNSLWSFSGGSFQDRRNLLAAQLDCLLELGRQPGNGRLLSRLSPFLARRNRYSRATLTKIPVKLYYKSLEKTFQDLATFGTELSVPYLDFVQSAQPVASAFSPAVNCCSEDTRDRFREEEQRADALPPTERLIERFLCLVYIGFIQTMLVRLRGLAFSFVSLFSLIALSVAIYPFQPMQAFLCFGFGMFVVIAVASIVVYSQMDKDRVLSRVLNSDPTKLEGSFYGKVIETLMPPLLTLGTSLLPGGAGRLVDMVAQMFGHGP